MEAILIWCFDLKKTYRLSFTKLKLDYQSYFTYKNTFLKAVSLSLAGKIALRYDVFVDCITTHNGRSWPSLGGHWRVTERRRVTWPSFDWSKDLFNRTDRRSDLKSDGLCVKFQALVSPSPVLVYPENLHASSQWLNVCNCYFVTIMLPMILALFAWTVPLICPSEMPSLLLLTYLYVVRLSELHFVATSTFPKSHKELTDACYFWSLIGLFTRSR